MRWHLEFDLNLRVPVMAFEVESFVVDERRVPALDSRKSKKLGPGESWREV